MPKRKCVICHKREATLPDRNRMSLVLRVCRECHADRLRGDWARIAKADQQAKTGKE